MSVCLVCTGLCQFVWTAQVCIGISGLHRSVFICISGLHRCVCGLCGCVWSAQVCLQLVLMCLSAQVCLRSVWVCLVCTGVSAVSVDVSAQVCLLSVLVCLVCTGLSAVCISVSAWVSPCVSGSHTSPANTDYLPLIFSAGVAMGSGHRYQAEDETTAYHVQPVMPPFSPSQRPSTSKQHPSHLTVMIIC